MYNFDKAVSTTKKSKWTNSCKWIIIHHTAWGTFESNIRYLSTSPAQASVHFVIWENWECAKIWDPRDILRHAGNGSWWDVSNVNTAFLWIEVVWFGKYNLKQFLKLTDLVQYLMWVYWIKNDMILRHSDVTQDGYYTKNKILRDWKRKCKKSDIGLEFFVNNDGFKLRRDQLIW